MLQVNHTLSHPPLTKLRTLPAWRSAPAQSCRSSLHADLVRLPIATAALLTRVPAHILRTAGQLDGAAGGSFGDSRPIPYHATAVQRRAAPLTSFGVSGKLDVSLGFPCSRASCYAGVLSDAVAYGEWRY